MSSNDPVLVIGAISLRDSLARAMPHADLRWCDNPLQGVWTFGAQPCERIVISLDVGAVLPRVIDSIRKLAPDARIILVGRPHHEPIARHLLNHGATDYALEPIARDEIETLLNPPPPAASTPTMTTNDPQPQADENVSEHPTPGELTALGRILQSLADGPAATLERLCKLIQDSLPAVSVVIELDDLRAQAGTMNETPHVQTIERGGQPVGRLLYSAGRNADAGAISRRAAEYARLIDAYVLQAREQQQLRELAWTDHLTGLKNRRYFEDALTRLISRAAADRSSVTLLLFDIDDFKSYNDRFGYEVGDGLLREISMLIGQCCREQDIVARFGGDEFAVVFWDAEEPRLPGSTHPTAPTVLADRFHRVLNAHRFKCLGPHAPASVTISGGLASFPWDGRTTSEMVRAAEGALRAAKKIGKNRIQLAIGNTAT